MPSSALIRACKIENGLLIARGRNGGDQALNGCEPVAGIGERLLREACRRRSSGARRGFAAGRRATDVANCCGDKHRIGTDGAAHVGRESGVRAAALRRTRKLRPVATADSCAWCRSSSCSMPRSPVMVCSACFACSSWPVRVCSCCCMVWTSWISWAMAGASITAHCALAGGAAAAKIVNPASTVRWICLSMSFSFC